MSIAAGYVHTCAALRGGGVVCWGSNGYGQLGLPGSEVVSSKVPVAIGFFRPPTAVREYFTTSTSVGGYSTTPWSTTVFSTEVLRIKIGLL